MPSASSLAHGYPAFRILFSTPVVSPLVSPLTVLHRNLHILVVQTLPIIPPQKLAMSSPCLPLCKHVAATTTTGSPPLEDEKMPMTPFVFPQYLGIRRIDQLC